MKSLLLDRDGVINPLIEREEKEISPQRFEEFEFLQGAKRAIKRAKDAGYKVIVFTNQPDVNKDWRELDENQLERMNKKLLEVGVDAVYACKHGPMGDSEEERNYREDGRITVCDCRKPQPGLLEKAAEENEIDVEESYVIGDSEKDIETASRFEEKHDEIFAGRLAIGFHDRQVNESFDNLRDAIDFVVS